MEEVDGVEFTVKRASKPTRSCRSIFTKSKAVNVAAMTWIAGLQGPNHDAEKIYHEQFGSLLNGTDGCWFGKILVLGNNREEIERIEK